MDREGYSLGDTMQIKIHVDNSQFNLALSDISLTLVCATTIMTPNEKRPKIIKNIVTEQKLDGISVEANKEKDIEVSIVIPEQLAEPVSPYDYA